MKPAYEKAAGEINELWRLCLLRADAQIPFMCPSNEEVAAIIAKHCERNDTPESHKDETGSGTKP